MEGPARVAVEPGADLGVLVDGLVVQDRVDDLAGWDGRLDRVEEADELLMPVALHAAADHLARQHVQARRITAGRTVANLILEMASIGILRGD